MKSAIFLIVLFLAGCQSTYSPAEDGRVSVVDLVLFPTTYAGQTVISPGYLQWKDGAATLFFAKDHIARRSTRFAVPLDVDAEQAQSCHGAEVLVKGVMTQTETGWVLVSKDAVVC